MFVIVAGGGKVGFYLGKELAEQGHEVVIIEQEPRRAAEIENELGNMVFVGDAAETITFTWYRIVFPVNH